MSAQAVENAEDPALAPGPGATGATALERLLCFAALLAFWFYCHPYFGNMHGSLIYTARALADLDPAGVGLDAMFRMDGQSGYTIFRPLFGFLTGAVGAPVASIGVALAATLSFFVSTWVLAAQMARGRARPLIVAFVAALPAFYGGYGIFAFAEASATPRPFAESLVILGVAALLAQRRAVAAICMVAAIVLHPIMALAGVAVLALWLLCDDRRWIWLWLLVGALTLAAAGAGVAPFSRIAQRVDPDWFTILQARNPLLFPDLWQENSVGRLVAKCTALLIAASFAPPLQRRLFMIVVLAGAGGVIAAHVFGDQFRLLLFVQAQTWRLLWLVSALGSAAAALCVVELWKGDNTARLTLIFLALSLLLGQYGMASCAFAATALALRFGVTGATSPVPDRVFWAILAVAAALFFTGMVYAYSQNEAAFALIPPDMAGKVALALGARPDLTLLCAAIGVWSLGMRRPAPLWALAAMFAVAAVAAPLNWDRRTAVQRFTDSTPPLPDLHQLLASRPGEIYWINGVREPWSWAGRPAWVSGVQGASIVFSRDLAMQFRDRSRQVIEAGIGDDEMLTPLTEPHLQKYAGLSRSRVRAFCAAPGAPAWVVAPLLGEEKAGTGEIEWTAPVEKIQIFDAGGRVDFQRIQRYTLIPCAG
ncbi:MAG: hypothetical protein QM651_17520 [Rhodoblastus sp.]